MKTEESRTYVSRQRSRGCEEFGGCDLVYTDTVHADGRVVSSVRGESDGERVAESREWHAGGPVDFAKVDSARLASGWARVSA